MAAIALDAHESSTCAAWILRPRIEAPTRPRPSRSNQATASGRAIAARWSDWSSRGAGVSRQRGAGMGLSKPLSKPCLGAVPYSAAAGAGIQDRVPWQRTAMSPLAAAASARLPAGWEQHADEQGTPYYHNAIEGVTTWRRPGGSRRGGSDGARAGRHAHASRHRQQRDQQRDRHSAPRCAHGTADAAQGDGDDSGGESGEEGPERPSHGHR